MSKEAKLEIDEEIYVDFLVILLTLYLYDTARRIARVSKEAKLEIDEEIYVDFLVILLTLYL